MTNFVRAIAIANSLHDAKKIELIDLINHLEQERIALIEENKSLREDLEEAAAEAAYQWGNNPPTLKEMGYNDRPTSL